MESNMLLRFADNRDPESLASKMRRKRMELLRPLLANVPEPVRVLDIGGRASFWSGIRAELPMLALTVLNLVGETPEVHGPDTRFVIGDARALPFDDRSFDVCFSNSVIEHVGSFEDQRAMASELRRVGERYFVQTPHKYFPIEAHFHVPGWQFMPLELRARLHQRFNLGWLRRQRDLDAARAYVQHIRLLATAEYRALFPDARIHYERVGPLIKSMIAVRGE
jgi:SAM-dependent methyltransferase